VSHVSEVIDLYLYDLEVSDDLFRKLLLDAIDRDMDQLYAVRLAAHPGYSVRV
jgi:fibrillarin-like rRNA methylase